MESTVLITITPEAKELIAFAHTFLGTAEAVRITTPEEAQAAVDQTRKIKECGKAVDEVLKSYTAPLREQEQAYRDVFRPAQDVLGKSEQLLKGALNAWDTEQRRMAAAAAEEQRKRDQAERDRLAEEQRKADDLLKQADQAAASGDVARAEQLEQQAAAVQTSAVYVPAPVVLASEKPKGAAVKQVWKCRIVDPKKVPPEFTIPNEKALDAYAKAMKENASLPGCEFYAEGSVSIR